MVNPNGSEAYDLSLFEPREPKLVALKPNKKAVKEARRRARVQSFLNTALTLLRRRKTGLFASLDEVSRTLAGRVAEECGEDADQMQVRFQQAVLELPLKQRLVFNLRYYDGMSYRQIARVLGQREQTLKVNYHYAVQKLKEKLTQEI